MELLVRWRCGPHQVVVHAAAGDRLEDGVAGVRITEVAPPDEQDALGVREQARHLRQQLRAGCLRELLAGEHQGDLLAGRRELLEHDACLARRAHTADAVVGCVPIAQLPLDVPQQAGVVIDGDQQGLAHASGPGRRTVVAHTPVIVGADDLRHQT
jgi:hypothetical protein